MRKSLSERALLILARGSLGGGTAALMGRLRARRPHFLSRLAARLRSSGRRDAPPFGFETRGRAPNSRASAQSAGWSRQGDEREDPNLSDRATTLLNARQGPKWDSFSWLTVRALFESVNDVVAKTWPGEVQNRRARWVAAQRADASSASPVAVDVGSAPGNAGSVTATTARFARDFLIDYSTVENPSFIVVGDTGEQDASQYVVAPQLNDHGKATTFMVILSDVIYPAGDVNEYVNGFYIPYREYGKPIYAIPGNHDWYDGLNGFMFHFCRAEPLPPERFRLSNLRPGERLPLLLWRPSEPPDRLGLGAWRDSRADQSTGLPGPVQPAPYFAIDVGPLRLVCIDTGVAGEIDAEQGRWLIRMSRGPKPKVLLTGKPIYVDNRYEPGPIDWHGELEAHGDEIDEPALPAGVADGLRDVSDLRTRFKTVDDVVRHKTYNYVAALGGDIHNYQRYPVRLGDGRPMQYVVSGGGGAFLSDTHRIPEVGGEPEFDERHPWPKQEGICMPGEQASDKDQASEEKGHFRCYPLRGDSLAYSAQRAAPRLFKASLAAALGAVAAAVLLAQLLRQEPESLRPELTGALAGLLTLVVFGVMAGLVVPRLSRWFWLRGARGMGPLFGFVFLGAFVLAGAALLRVALPLILGQRPTLATALIAAGVVPALLAGVVVTYLGRGSTPRATHVVMVTAALLAGALLWASWAGLLGHLSSWGWLALLIGASAALALTAVLRAGALERRKRLAATVAPLSDALVLLAWDLLVAGAYVQLAIALGVRLGTGVVWPEVAAVGAGVIVLGAIIPLLAKRRARRRVRSRIDNWGSDTTRFLTRGLAGFAWVTGALVLLEDAAGGGAARYVVVSAAVVLAVLAVAFFFGLALGLRHVPSSSGVLLGLGALALGYIPVPEASVYVLAFVALVMTFVSGRTLRGARLNANFAAKYAANHLSRSSLKPVRPAARGERLDDPGRVAEKKLARFMFPFHNGKPRNRKGPVGALADASVKAVSQLSDTDEPPFFKSFLRFDVDTAKAELRIRCFGVTGYESEEAPNAPVEDDFVVSYKPVIAAAPTGARADGLR